MKRMLIVVAMLVFAQGYVIASDVTTFKDGTTEGIADLQTPTFTDTIEMTIPAESHIVKASMDVSSVPPNQTIMSSPENVSLYLNDTLVWRYDGPDYGFFGLQDSFVNESATMESQFGPSGGQTITKIRLPKRANVQNASFEVDCEAAWKGLILETNLTGAGNFGTSIGDAGDVNNDGYDDLIVGAPTTNASQGAVYIFFGGSVMDNGPDVVLTGENPGDCFGYSVAGIGDMDNDGYDDVVVGAPYNDAMGPDSGKVYIYRGGASMDSIPDAVAFGAWGGNQLGFSVSAAGNVNNDAYADVIVGAPFDNLTTTGAGAAYILYGGQNIDGLADVVLPGGNTSDNFGYSVSTAGDVNKDGFSDVVVGAPNNASGGMASGSAFIYFGGANMNNVTDVTLMGASTGDMFGASVSDAGDVNNDGYGDVIVGAYANDTIGIDSGKAYIYYGGASMDNTPEVVLAGTAAGDYFGAAVTDAGDLNNDGYDDVMVGAYGNDTAGSNAGSASVFFGGLSMDNVPDITFRGAAAADSYGKALSFSGDCNGDGFTGVVVGTASNKAYLYESAFGMKEPQVSVGQTLTWSKSWYYNGSGSPGNFADMLNNYISSNYATGADLFGNTYIDVPVRMSCKSDGQMSVSGLMISYVCTQPLPEFTDTLETYKTAHHDEKGVDGNITVPFKLTSATAGSLVLTNLRITIDEAPKLLSKIPDFEMDEDTIMSDQINLREYFSDDYDSIENIQFSLVSSTNSSEVFVELLLNGFVSIDALSGSSNDNWTGTVEIQVNASDRWGSTTLANPFRVFVNNVPDAPIITSQPNLTAVPGQEYVYNVTAADGDNDPLTFDLPQKPAGMTIDPVIGNISWRPSVAGRYAISISVTDGNFTVFQNYSIDIPNRIPYIANYTIPEASVNTLFEYAIPAADPDGNPLNFSFVTPVLGMSLTPSGTITWTPTQSGTFPVSVAISDGKDTIRYDFNVTVRQPNRAPKFTSNPVTSGVEGVQYNYTPMAIDDDKNTLTFSLVSGPTGMTVDNATGQVLWTPPEDGDFAVSIKVSDGLGGEAKQEFTIKVVEAAAPKLTVQDPAFTDKWSGKVTISGIVKKGTHDVTSVEIKVDSGDWKKAAGTLSWNYVVDTKALKNGKHTLSARAYDGKLFSDVFSDTFTVNNAAAAKTDYTMWIIIAVVVLVLAAAAGAGLAMSKKKRPPAETAAEAEEEESPPEDEDEAAPDEEEEEAVEKEKEADAKDAKEAEDDEEPVEKPKVKIKKK
jgi:hypothetical protein